MGSTDSKPKPSLQKQYKLIRRFMSALYGNSQVTVIEHKQTQQQFVLRQFIQQFNPQVLLGQLQTHRSLSHKNLIQLRRFWIQNDVNICSSLFKIFAVFEHHEISLEEWLLENKDENVSDRNVADFLKQMNGVLNFLERNRIFWLLSGAKNIAVFVEKQQQLKQKYVCTNTQGHRKSASKFDEELSKNGRRSLIVSGDYFRNNQEQFKTTFRKQSYSHLPHQGPTEKIVYKIFDPLQNLSSNKSIQKLQHYLQVPPHPNISNLNENTLLSNPLVRQQNSLTVSLIAIAMCQKCQFGDLDIYRNGKVSLSKLNRYIEGMRINFPRTVRELQKNQITMSNLNNPVRMSQGLKIKDVSLMKKRQESKENITPEHKLDQNTGKKSMGSIGIRTSCRRISLNQI